MTDKKILILGLRDSKDLEIWFDVEEKIFHNRYSTFSPGDVVDDLLEFEDSSKLFFDKDAFDEALFLYYN